jgi:hypothetical protein
MEANPFFVGEKSPWLAEKSQLISHILTRFDENALKPGKLKLIYKTSIEHKL